MKHITLDFDYTLNGMIRWAKGVAHEANDELRGLLADGVAGAENEIADVKTAAEATSTAAPASDTASAASAPAEAAPAAPAADSGAPAAASTDNAAQ